MPGVAPREWRVAVLMVMVVVLRDSLTPTGIWSFGGGRGGYWLRFSDDWVVLAALSAAGLLFFAFLNAWQADLCSVVVWRKRGSALVTGMLSLACACVGVLPFGLLNLVLRSGPAAASGTTLTWTLPPPPALLVLFPANLAFASIGSLLEELLFRGMVQGLLEPAMGVHGSIAPSALLYTLAHGFVASAVSDMGLPVYAFSLWLGLVLGKLRAERGTAPCVLAHALVLVVLSMGWV